jgi:HK97 family phage portal protein
MNKAFDWYKKTKSYFAKEIRLFSGSNEVVDTQNLPFLGNWMYAAKMGMPRAINVVELRQFAKSSWVQMITNAICKQVMTTEWAIISDDEDEDVMKKYEENIERATTFLKQPNRNGDSFWDIWVPWLRDVLEIDAGVMYKGRNVAGDLVELYSYDGARFLISLNEHGIIGEDSKGEPAPGYYQYSFRQVSAAPIPFKKNEIVYGRVNTNNELYPYGFSPLQSIQQEVELMIQSTRFNKERFKNSAVPDGIVSVPMDTDQMLTFKNAWETELKGRPHKLLFHNSDASFTPLSMTNKDMEWLEGQKWYFHLVFAAYGLSPQEVGFYENSNRSTGESQERITVKNAIKPYLELISAKINREILPDLLGHDELKFKWFPKDDSAEKIEHEQMMSKLTAGVLTINEVRAIEGLDPVDWGDQPMNIFMQDRFMENNEGEEGEDNPKDDKEDDKKPKSEDKEKERSKREMERATPDLYQKLFNKYMKNGE